MVRPADRPVTAGDMLSFFYRMRGVYWLSDVLSLRVTYSDEEFPAFVTLFGEVAAKEMSRYLGHDVPYELTVSEEDPVGYVAIHTESLDTTDDGDGPDAYASVEFNIEKWPQVNWRTRVFADSDSVDIPEAGFTILNTEVDFEDIAEQHKTDWEFWSENYVRYNT